MYQQLRDWFKEGKIAWLGFVLLILAMTVPQTLNARLSVDGIKSVETMFRWQGTAIEFAGLICVLIGLVRIRGQFGLPGIRHAIADYATRAILIFRRRPVSNSVIVTGVGSAVGIGTAVAYAKASGTIEDRVEQLEQRLQDFRSDFDKHKNNLAGDLKQLEVAQQEEKKAREAGDEAETRKLTETMTGDVQLELVGWFYICVGLFLANLSQELAQRFS